MELIKFHMPPFARLQWVSKDIKLKYEPMFENAKRVFNVLEKESVKYGLRTCTTASIKPEEYDAVTQELAKNNMIFLPIQKVGVYFGHSSYHPPVIEGKPYVYYGVVSNNIQDANSFVEASKAKAIDHETLGELLGYPKCCVKSFSEQFTKGIIDPQWNAAVNDVKHIKTKNEFEDKLIIRSNNTNWETNTTLRNFSIGPMFHYICSNGCSSTLELSKKWIKLAEELKIDGLKEMEMFLRMPMEWDCLKGIAYIRTPLFKASINSNFSIKQHVVQREGTYYPEDAPRAIRFPWNEYYKVNKKDGYNESFKYKCPTSDQNTMGI